ncbi:GD14393 [Drosophila simulans]|uniref:GD14393 n=1 Tax=Drosophila simulans TaxID=7240 RepID=B4NVU0_DROSI|nr:GD14393 [Drosophila simulans]
MPYSNRILKEESSKCDAVPQPALQGPYEPEYLYTLFTAILPIIPSRYLTSATYADDTAFLATATNPQRASAIIERQLDALDPWLKRWNIVVNAEKSSHTTFSLRRGECPPVTLDGDTIPTTSTPNYLGVTKG